MAYKILKLQISTLEKATLWLPNYNGADLAILDLMHSLISRVDFKKMPFVFRDEKDEILEGMDFTYLYCDNDELAEDFENSFESKETISGKIDELLKRLSLENLIKDTSFSSKFGEVQGFEDYLDILKDFIVRAATKYLNVETTNLLNYKLF